MHQPNQACFLVVELELFKLLSQLLAQACTFSTWYAWFSELFYSLPVFGCRYDIFVVLRMLLMIAGMKNNETDRKTGMFPGNLRSQKVPWK
jgi:hypothetical protein